MVAPSTAPTAWPDCRYALKGFATTVGVPVVHRPATGNAPFPGTDSFGFVTVDPIEGLDAARVCHRP
ncbi:hypothetical protein [Chelatococcus asaccharovorans]|uniref:Uncharacterized protein n=1 Tax=Chelatococcus asaccharovorans TaxID=28210 RepID=A0A2V3UWJ0_9HYPH|nr:hypothetical protein [Chelatococcus asaccharovorans]MBS7706293.1 hypothetical protein [Chelatococcus asaccharovorans]PXW65068.1 hypothetical protein C7450_101831 [Chelatococcus asaccharovorans]